MERIEWLEEYLEEAMRLAYDAPMAIGGHEPTLRLLDKLLFEEPGYGRLHFTLGKVYFNYADDVVRAERHFRLAIRFDGEFADTYLYLGNLLSEDERHNEAVDLYLQGLNAKRAYKTELYNGAARSYELMKKYKKAISHYRDALRSSAEPIIACCSKTASNDANENANKNIRPIGVFFCSSFLLRKL